MKPQTISVGDSLKLKKERQDAYGMACSTVTVVEIKPGDAGYKTPWLKCRWDANYGYFRPSDFSRHS